MRPRLPSLTWVTLLLLALVSAFLGVYVHQVHFHYRFTTITVGRVYASGNIPPSDMARYVRRYHLRTVVDLRRPEEQADVAAERITLQKLDVGYVHLPTGMVPSRETVDRFLALMARPESYPVLIHGRHGVDRPILFGALYRIAFEGWDNERARKATRVIVEGSGFDTTAPMGRYLRSYAPPPNPPTGDPHGLSGIHEDATP